MSSLSRFAFAGPALALALSSCARPVDAPSEDTATAVGNVRLQGRAGGEVEFTGAVQSITPPRLVVSGINVVTTPATEIKRGQRDIPLTDLRVGESVKVEGTLEADGTVTAREIEAQAAPAPTPSPLPTPSPTPRHRLPARVRARAQRRAPVRLRARARRRAPRPRPPRVRTTTSWSSRASSSPSRRPASWCPGGR